MLKTSRLLISAMSSPPSLSRSQELLSSVPKLWYFWTMYCKSARTLIQPSRIVFSLACLRGGKGWDSWVSAASSSTQCNDSSSLLMVPNTPGAALPGSLSVNGSSSEVLSYMTGRSSTLIGLRPQSRLYQIQRERTSLIGGFAAQRYDMYSSCEEMSVFYVAPRSQRSGRSESPVRSSSLILVRSDLPKDHNRRRARPFLPCPIICS